jgi:AraC-like DNA-binding protein
MRMSGNPFDATAAAVARPGRREPPPAAAGPRPLSSGWARVGWLRGLPQVLRDFDCDAERVIAESGIEASVFEDDQAALSFRAGGELFERCVQATGCPHFALLVGSRFDPAVLGDTASLMARSPNVGAALRTLILRFHLLDEGAVPMLLPATGGRAILAHSIYARDVPALDQFADLSMAIAVKLLKGLCGHAFQPLRVSLPHRPPADPAAYQRVLGPNVTYNGELAAVVFASSWLHQPVVGGHAAPRGWPDVGVAAQSPMPAQPLAHLVRRALRPMVFTGTAAEAATARMFSLHPRALRRQLRAEGETFLGLLNETRLAVAQQLLRDTDLRIAEIAAAMHYSDATALTRAFRAQAGTSPTAWRQRERMLAPEI